MRSRADRHRGFSLVELMLVVALLAAVALIAVPAYQGVVERARISQAVRDIGELAMALERRRTTAGSYPASLAELGGGLPELDPWGRPYRYLAIDVRPRPSVGSVRRDKNLNPLNRDFDLYSVGPDGQTQTQLSGARARDDIVRAGNGSFIGKAEDH